MADVKTAVYLTVHGCATKSVEQLADEMGVQTSYLYRATSDGESQIRFPLELLIPLMQATGDYRVLDHLNGRCGRATVAAPKVRALKRKSASALNDVQRNFTEAFAEFCEFWDDPDPAKKEALLGKLQAHMCDVAAMKRAVAEFEQGDLFE